MNRTIIVGDIHGCYDELRDLLDRLSITGDDRIVSTGDLIVKGPRNRDVLELFSHDSRFSSVIGNHDLSILRGWLGEKKLSPEQERCREELESDREFFQSYIASLPAFIELAACAVVHAGVRPGVGLAEQSVRELTVRRTLNPENPGSRDGVPWYEVYDGEQFIVFGHWAGGEVRRGRRALGIDTGCVYGGRLTAYVVETEELVSVPARAAYSDFGRPLT